MRRGSPFSWVLAATLALGLTASGVAGASPASPVAGGADVREMQWRTLASEDIQHGVDAARERTQRLGSRIKDVLGGAAVDGALRTFDEVRRAAEGRAPGESPALRFWEPDLSVLSYVSGLLPAVQTEEFPHVVRNVLAVNDVVVVHDLALHPADLDVSITVHVVAAPEASVPSSAKDAPSLHDAAQGADPIAHFTMAVDDNAVDYAAVIDDHAVSWSQARLGATPCDSICEEFEDGVGFLGTAFCGLVGSAGGPAGALIGIGICGSVAAGSSDFVEGLCQDRYGYAYAGCEGTGNGAIVTEMECDLKDCEYAFLVRDSRKQLHNYWTEHYFGWCAYVPKPGYLQLSCGPYNTWQYFITRIDAGNLFDNQATYRGAFSTRGRYVKLDGIRECSTVVISWLTLRDGSSSTYVRRERPKTWTCEWPL